MSHFQTSTILLFSWFMVACSSSTPENPEKQDDPANNQSSGPVANETENGNQFTGTGPVFDLSRSLTNQTTSLINTLNRSINSGTVERSTLAPCLNGFDSALGKVLLDFDCGDGVYNDDKTVSWIAGGLVSTDYCQSVAASSMAQNCAIANASMALPLAWIAPENNGQASVRPIPLLGATISYANGALSVDTAEQVGNAASNCVFDMTNNGVLSAGNTGVCAERVTELSNRLNN